MLKNKSQKVSVRTQNLDQPSEVDQDEPSKDETPTEKVFGFPVDKNIANELTISQKEDLYFEK